VTSSKKTPATVWVVEEVAPYDGSEVVGVHASLEGAKEAHLGWTSYDRRPGWRWRLDGERWTNAPRTRDSAATLLMITEHEVRP